MKNLNETQCYTDTLNYTYLPSISSISNINISKYNEELYRLEKISNKPFVAQEAKNIYNNDTIRQQRESLYNNIGDARFNGLAVYNFLTTRYKTVDSPPVTSIPYIGCSEDGDTYTFTTSLNIKILDRNSTEIKVPIFDKYGQRVFFPLRNLDNQILKTEALTAIDNSNQIIYFPLKNVKLELINYPFYDENGNILYTPPLQNEEIITDSADAFDNLRIAQNNAKDSHAYKFAKYIKTLEEQNIQISFFKVNLTNFTSNLKVSPSSFFGVAIFDEDCSDKDLTDPVNICIHRFIRYYTDRSDLVYNLYKDLCGTAPITELVYSSEKDFYENEKVSFVVLNLFKQPVWSESYNKITTRENLYSNLPPIHKNNIVELYNYVNKTAAALATPVGSISIFPSASIPTGWLKCDGSEVDIIKYQDLYNVLQQTFKTNTSLDTNIKFQLPSIGTFSVAVDYCIKY